LTALLSQKHTTESMAPLMILPDGVYEQVLTHYLCPYFLLNNYRTNLPVYLANHKIYKLYYLSPWSALPVTKLVLPTANENIGLS